MSKLLKVSIRQKAILVDGGQVRERKELSQPTMALLANVKKLGFTFSEPLLHALDSNPPSVHLKIYNTLQIVTGINKNWTPLVKGWDTPTGESIIDHLATWFHNITGSKRGTRLQCGHLIPDNTFPLERYNGCPFCGTPFEFGEIEHYGQGSKLKVLDLWTLEDAQAYLTSLLTSKTALDATQIDSLKMLLDEFPVPEVEISMKETAMVVIDALIEKEKADEAQTFFNSPNDILRYLWYKKTGFLQLIEPKTIVERTGKNDRHIGYVVAPSGGARSITAKEKLKLKYSRKDCRMVAKWLNDLDLSIQKCCEIMHPKRGMWVRFIRALRLAEYSKRQGFEKLAKLLDVFYNEKYTVFQGRVNHYRLRYDSGKTFAMLQERPGLFARSLFANMLWFGADDTTAAFGKVIDKVPARLVFTLSMYAENYFDKSMKRSVKPLGGTNKRIAPNRLLELYDDEQLKYMKDAVQDLCLLAMEKRFANIENEHQSIFIDEQLYKIPVAIGDRSESVQDLPSALMGTRFPIEGDKVRLFMQWGKGLKAQHLDMDLSCMVAYENKTARCSYSRLVATGCKHSGDIINIPHMVGTAEYIELNVPQLEAAGAKYVSFTCNAYSRGSISPNLVVGWMNSAHPMKISEKTGVAYDPSCVQHQVRVTQTLSKGLVFGVLDVEAREIVWLEMSFGGQVVQNLDVKGVKTLLSKLDSKLNIGHLLEIKAAAQGLEIITDFDEADEVYDTAWAQNAAAVTQLLVD